MIDHMPIPRAGMYSVQPRQSWYLPLKALVDFSAGLALLVLLSPVILIAALLVKLTSPGPAFYLQTRVGKDGRLFRMIKLRSMREDAELRTGAVWCRSRDDRITPIGLVLRATHIDEFPQLINVIKGDMSLIGPRPERPEFVREFERNIDGYAERLSVRPGITGIAQLRLPPDTDLGSVQQKLEFDLYYVRCVSPLLDAVALIATAVHFTTSLLRWIVPAALCLPQQEQVRAEWDRLRSGPLSDEMLVYRESALAMRAEQALTNSAT